MTNSNPPSPPPEHLELRAAIHKIVDHATNQYDDGNDYTTPATKKLLALFQSELQKQINRAILETWNYTSEGYNGEYDGLTHNGGKRYTVEEVEAKVLKDVNERLEQLKQEGDSHE